MARKSIDMRVEDIKNTPAAMRGMPACERVRTQVHMYSGSVVLLLEIMGSPKVVMDNIVMIRDKAKPKAITTLLKIYLWSIWL